jgi:hypothetical protein
MVHKAILGRQRAHDAEIEKAVEARFAKQVAQIEKGRKTEIAKAVREATQMAEVKLAAIRSNQTGVVAAALAAEHERSEKAVAAAVEATKIEFATEKVRLEATLADVQRKLQSRTPHDRGEPAEVSLFDAIIAVLPPTDIVRRIEKGRPGVDVVVEIVSGNSVVGKIAIDSKAHARWQNSFCQKLRADQLREKAAFGILSSSVFPKNASQLHVQDGVIVCYPDRVPVLVTLLRRIILDGHVQKRSTEARNKKAEAALSFLVSREADDLLEKLVERTRSLETLDATEKKTHASTWTKRAALIREVLEVHTDFTTAISGIVSGEGR